MVNSIVEKIKADEKTFVDIRHAIHQHPELGLEEVITSDLVAQKLTDWGYTVHRGMGKTGVVGTLKVGNGKKTLGLRADMDALPIHETSGKPWSSKIANKFHGCGHDGHTTMLLAAAKYLADTRHFDGTVHLIFQPAEETLFGGKLMIEDGLFEKFPCDAIFGMHNMPGMKTGDFYFTHGAMMASSDAIEIKITGVGAHGAMPEKGIDATLVACYIGTALQSIVARNVPPSQAAVITIGCIESGDAPNVVNAEAIMKLSIRALDKDVRELVLRRIEDLAKSQAASFGATATLRTLFGAPVLVNGNEATDFAISVAEKLVGKDRVHPDTPQVMGSEDFAYMLEANPNGCYMFVGNGDEPGFCNVHNPGYDFNDDVITTGASYWALLTETYLK